MTQDFSWRGKAQLYLALFRDLVAPPAGDAD
jgi:hypothetical protein